MKNKLQITLLFLNFILFGIISKAQNNALNFDGVDDYVNLNALSNQISGYDPFTVEFTMKTNEASSQALFAINGQSSDWSTQHAYVLLVSTSGDLELWIGGATNNNISKYYANDFISDNECHHIAMTVSTQVTVYIDGVSKIIATPHPHPLNSSHLYSLGQEWDGWAFWSNYTGQPSQFYNGDLDEVRVWSTARSQSQIYDNKDLQLTGNEPNLIALYNCNQGIANGNNTSILNLNNSSLIQNLDGTIVNMALSGNTSNFIINPCSDCFALQNPEYTQITTDITYTQSTIWSGKYYIADGVIISVDNDAVLDLTNVDVVFGECSGINFINGATVRANNSVFRPCAIDGSWKGFTFDGTQPSEYDNQINESTFKNAEIALFFNNGADGLISNNLFSNCNQGVRIEKSDNYDHSISGNRFVTDNFYPEFTNCYTFTNTTSYGIYTQSVKFNSQITQNEFTSALEKDVYNVGIEEINSGGIISNNTFTDMNNSLNIISPYFYTSINSNIIEKNTGQDWGLLVDNATTSIVEINDNLLSNHHENNVSQIGISIEKSRKISISNNEIDGFNIGIQSAYSEDVEISENIISNARRIGVSCIHDSNTEKNTYITCNKITMKDFSGIGISVRNLNRMSKILNNCIFDSQSGLNLSSTIVGASNLPLIRNNYIYNYRKVGVNINGYTGNIGAIGDPGMNTFWSNNNTSIDIQSNTNITVADNFGMFNIGYPQVQITSNNPTHSTASCANQIYNMPSQGNLNVNYKCNNITLSEGVTTSDYSNPLLKDNYLDILSNFSNKFEEALVIIMTIKETDETLLNEIIANVELNENEKYYLKYYFYIKQSNYIKALQNIDLIIPLNESENVFIDLNKINLKVLIYGWNSLTISEREILNSATENNINFAIAMTNNTSEFKKYIINYTEQPEIIKTQNVMNVEHVESELTIYPTPSSKIINIDLINLNNNDKVNIYDISGKSVKNYSINFVSGVLTLDISNLNSGVYFITISDQINVTKKGKFVKL